MVDKKIFYYDISKKGKDLLGNKDAPVPTNEQAIKESVFNLFFTQPGSRLMNPLYGIDLDRYLFEPIDELTASLMQSDIEFALSAYEPRITDINIDIVPDIEQQTFLITINYSVVFTSAEQTLKIDFRKIR